MREGKPLKRTVLHESCEWEGERVEITTGAAEYSGLRRSIKKARGGKLAYKWGHNDKFARVVWEKSAAK